MSALLEKGVVLFDKYVVSQINFSTLAILFCLMGVVEGFRKLGYIDNVAGHFKKISDRIRWMESVMLFSCFIFAMFLTNDVALIIMVPFTIQILEEIGREDLLVRTIVLETIAANIGGMGTPIGNPQNLYLYRYYHMDLEGFFRLVLPYTGAALVLLLLLIMGQKSGRVEKNEKIVSSVNNEKCLESEKSEKGVNSRISLNSRESKKNRESHVSVKTIAGKKEVDKQVNSEQEAGGRMTGEQMSGGQKADKLPADYDLADKRETKRTGQTAPKGKAVKTVIYVLLFVLCVLTVLGKVTFTVTFLSVAVTMLLIDRELLKNINYGLLFKFVCLFLLVGNIAAIPLIREELQSLVAGREFLTGILLSQVISNVPAAVMLSRFTTNGGMLLVAVDVGGLGTLIASMASMISFDFYLKSEGSSKRKYLLQFTGYNLLFLLMMVVVYLLFG